jgi:hypothetical protein
MRHDIARASSNDVAHEGANMSEDSKCGACGKMLGSFESITVAGVGDRCYPCFNREMADRLSVDFDSTPLQPIVVPDLDGTPHTFQIRSMLVATGHEMEALEITNDGQLGYCFRVLGELEIEAWELFSKLYESMRREMSKRCVECTERGWQIAADQHVRGRIEWDPETNGELPLIVIDGKPFTWEQVGRMLMTFEGFTLDARVEDTIQLVGEARC